MNYRAHTYRSADGRLDLFARDYGGDAAEDRPALLLMHGLTRNSADFEPLVPHLADRYRLIVPDQRGRGRSQYDPEPANYRPDVYSADMFALLDGLEIERAGLIGTSMGGLMAMVMGAMQAPRVAAVVMNDVGPVLDPAGLQRIAGYVGGALDFADWDAAADACAAINAEAFPDFGHADWLAFARRTCVETEGGRVAFAYDPAISSGFSGDDEADGRQKAEIAPPDMWPLWEALSGVPALVVRGELSDLLSAATVAEMDRRHVARFMNVEVPGRGHAPLLGEPAAVNALLAFLAVHWPA